MPSCSSFKKDILDGIDKKFVDLERTIQGDTAYLDSSAVADLGAKVSLLSSAKHAGCTGYGSVPSSPTPPRSMSTSRSSTGRRSAARGSLVARWSTTQTRNRNRRATATDAASVVLVAPADLPHRPSIRVRRPYSMVLKGGCVYGSGRRVYTRSHCARDPNTGRVAASPPGPRSSNPDRCAMLH